MVNTPDIQAAVLFKEIIVEAVRYLLSDCCMYSCDIKDVKSCRILRRNDLAAEQLRLDLIGKILKL